MVALNITDLSNGKLNLDHIDELANSAAATAVDRFGVAKTTVAGAIDSLKAFNSRGAWVTATAYAVRDLVSNAGTWYVCVVAHTSSAAFATDSPSKWRIHQSAVLPDLIVRADYGSDAAFNAAKAGKASLDASYRFRSASHIAGDFEPTGATLRDAFIVGRNVIGSTDCHGYADRTIMSGVTDYGGYGSFDMTVKLMGSNAQDHMYSFQDRGEYNGSGSINKMIGFYSAASHTGTGTIAARNGVDIGDMSKTGGGTITEQVGIRIRNMTTGNANYGMIVDQISGYAIYSIGAAKSQFNGSVGVGTNPDSLGLKFAVKGTAVGAATYAIATSATSVQTGGIENVPLQVLVNAGVRLEVTASGSNYTVRPGADGTQPLGDATRRWSVVYASSATILTSDNRAKDQIQSIPSAVFKAWARVNFCQFKMVDSVERKGADARWHFGLIAQEVKAAFDAEGLDPFAYGLLCHDTWEDQFDEDGNLVAAAGDRYGIRYEEALALECAYLRYRLSGL